ncbi:MAG: HYExAFE family protein [Phycisphaeraceae bacterium]
MAQRRFHYDVAFEQYLRTKAIPYVAVDEAKRALDKTYPPATLKSFDFVVYSDKSLNLLVDVKGRKHSGRSSKSLDNWVTRNDVDSLTQWEKLFGEGFEGAFAFLYWCDVQPPDALFHEIFECSGRWYAVLAIRLSDYRKHLKQRSPRWDTVNIPAATFSRLAVPLMEMI